MKGPLYPGLVYRAENGSTIKIKSVVVQGQIEGTDVILDFDPQSLNCLNDKDYDLVEQLEWRQK